MKNLFHIEGQMRMAVTIIFNALNSFAQIVLVTTALKISTQDKTPFCTYVPYANFKKMRELRNNLNAYR